MKLSRYETIQLYTAGTLHIPHEPEEYGEITIIPDGIAVQNKKEPLLQVVRRVSLDRTITYMLPLGSVAAILLKTEIEEEAEEDREVDEFDTKNWLLGRELANSAEPQKMLNAAAEGKKGKGTLGIVFVKEDTQVLVQALTKMAAAHIGEIPDEIWFRRRAESIGETSDPGGDPPGCRCCGP